MKVKILCFGITREILGSFEHYQEIPEGSTVDELKALLTAEFPRFAQLNSLRIALNENYGDGSQVIDARDEIVLIPPVSGG